MVQASGAEGARFGISKNGTFCQVFATFWLHPIFFKLFQTSNLSLILACGQRIMQLETKIAVHKIYLCTDQKQIE